MLKAASSRSEVLKEPAEILTDEDIAAMMAEAITVDALFQRMMTMPYGLRLIVTSYLAPTTPPANSEPSPE